VFEIAEREEVTSYMCIVCVCVQILKIHQKLNYTYRWRNQTTWTTQLCTSLQT